MNRSLRTVVVASRHPQRAELLDALLADTNDFDVIFVESIARSYSRIKQLTPDMVILFFEIEDVAACQLLSMLKIDRDVSGIPVVTCATRHDDSELADAIVEFDRDSPGRALAVSMN
jgi:DNA-binding NarL/FixJ family response regulator